MFTLPLRTRFVLLTFSLTAHAGPITSDAASSVWSNEAIFTLIGVIFAIAGILTSLVLASPTLRTWLSCPFSYCVQRTQPQSMRSLRNEVDEWLEFKEWKNLSKARSTV